MDTNGLRLFVIAAELLNISAAGRQLGLAPAVASARLAKLEKQVGADLLHRSTRSVSLSLEGQAFFPYAKEILAQEQAALAALGQGRADIQGTIRFAASSTFAQLYIAPILPEFLALHPGISIDLKLSDTQMNLIEGGFDLALRNYAAEDSSLVGRKIANDMRILCASPEYLKANGTPISPENLDQHAHILFMNSSPRKLKLDSERTTFMYPPKSASARMICDDGTSMRIAAKAGLGICMSSLWSVHADLAKGTLVRVLPDYKIDDQSAIWLLYPKSNVLTAKTRAFIDFLVEKIGSPPVWEH